VRAIDIVYAPFATLYNTRDGHAEEAGAVLTERLQLWDVPACAKDNPDRYATFFPIRVYEHSKDLTGKPFAMPQYSMSWWLSGAVRAALDAQVGAQNNEKQLDLLLQRLGQSGLPDCPSAP
jgi:hypothetical protein